MDTVRKENIERIGQVGEKIIRNYLGKLKGVRVEDSLNVYDSEKDAVIEVEVSEVDDESATIQATYINEDGKTVVLKTIEIKTCTPYVDKKAVTIRKKQLKKCQKVDELYFVTVPFKGIEYEYSGWILKIDPKTFEFAHYPKKDTKEPTGVRHMIAIKVRQKATTRIRKLYKSELRELLRFSTQQLSQQDIEELVEMYGDNDPVRRTVN
jgi:hypothetical protein